MEIPEVAAGAAALACTELVEGAATGRAGEASKAAGAVMGIGTDPEAGRQLDARLQAVGGKTAGLLAWRQDRQAAHQLLAADRRCRREKRRDIGAVDGRKRPFRRPKAAIDRRDVIQQIPVAAVGRAKQDQRVIAKAVISAQGASAAHTDGVGEELLVVGGVPLHEQDPGMALAAASSRAVVRHAHVEAVES